MSPQKSCHPERSEGSAQRRIWPAKPPKTLVILSAAKDLSCGAPAATPAVPAAGCPSPPRSFGLRPQDDNKNGCRPKGLVILSAAKDLSSEGSILPASAFAPRPAARTQHPAPPTPDFGMAAKSATAIPCDFVRRGALRCATRQQYPPCEIRDRPRAAGASRVATGGVP